MNTPTSQEVTESIVSQVELSIGQTVPILPKSFTRVLAKALSGVFVLLYKYAGWIFLQLFVAHASFRETTINGRKIRPLVEWGRLVGVGDPTPSVRAECTVTVTVNSQSGSLDAGTQLLNPDTGIVYTVLSGVLLDSATVSVTVRASLDGAGDIGNLAAGDVLTFANPLPNVAQDAVVASLDVSGEDAESEDDYRARVIRRFRARPQGGALADYQAWAESVSGITRAYVYRGDPGHVEVYAEATESSSGSEDGIPTSSQLTAVSEAIEKDVSGIASNRPVGALVNVNAISRQSFDLVVVGLTATDVPDAQSKITDAVEEFLRGREPFIDGLSVLPRQDRVTTVIVAGVVDQAANALGASVASTDLRIGGTSVASYSLGQGEKAKLGSVSWQ